MRALLFDLDGVVYNDEHVIPGAAETLDWVVGQGLPHLFVTNTTSKTPRALAEKLGRMGIKTDEARIVTPSVAAARWLRENRPGPVALFVPEATRDQYSGLDLLDDDAEAGASAVVIGDLAEAWTFLVLNRAFRLLMEDPPPHFIALGMTRYWRMASGLALDVGAIVAALEYATGRSPLVLGKPARPFFELAAETLGMPVPDVVMIGDDVRSDVKGAQDAGLSGVLVRTGKFQPRDLDRGVEPDEVLDSIAAVPAWWESRTS
jgi:HAD superfamily hydrolase (TIGR01458 family)